MRDSFIFYRSFYEAIKDLPRDIQGEIYTAIMEYSLYGKETDNLKPVARSIFTLIKPQIDVNNKRFDNGCKGGRPLKKETKEKPSNNQKETKEKPNKNYNVNDNNNDNYNCIDRDYDRCAVMSSDRSVGVADAPGVANAPGSANATQLYLPVELLIKGIEKLNLKFEGLISNEDMPKIIARTYEQRMRNNEEELSKKDIYMLMVEEFIYHPYLCEREPVEIACAYACGVKRKVSGSNPGDAA